jgi:hypothetical protein
MLLSPVLLTKSVLYLGSLNLAIRFSECRPYLQSPVNCQVCQVEDEVPQILTIDEFEMQNIHITYYTPVIPIFHNIA